MSRHGAHAASAGDPAPGIAAELERAREHRHRGQLQLAQAICMRVLAHDARSAAAWAELGACALAAGELNAAEHLLGRAAHAGGGAQALLDLGRVQLRLRRDKAAVHTLEQAAKMDPQRPDVLSDWGMALHRAGRVSEAINCYRRALALAPASLATRSNLASALKDIGDFHAATAQYEQILAEAPRDFRIVSNLLWAAAHDDSLPAADLYARHRTLGQRFTPLLQGSFTPAGVRATKPLRLGFVSADLRNHAVAFFLRPVWRSLDRQRFSVHAYACSEAKDSITDELRALCNGWLDVSTLDDEALARRIRADGIDILFDLSGHTAGNRLGVFARRVAPLQVSWIGYPCTTGLTAMDYLFSDAWMAPCGIDAGFTEKIVRQPAAVAFEPPAQLPPVQTPPALANGYLTFGSFHRPAKLSDRTLATWALLLQALPGTRLLLAHCDDPQARVSVSKRLEAHGIAPQRLSFHARLPLADYLALHHQVDIALDAVGFSGGTTTALALYMGVPVLTLAGEAMPTLQSAAILRHAGLPQFIAADPDDFVHRGTQWAQRLPELASLRLALRAGLESHPAMAPAHAVDGFQRAVQAIWDRWTQGLPPAALWIEPAGTAQAFKLDTPP